MPADVTDVVFGPQSAPLAAVKLPYLLVSSESMPPHLRPPSNSIFLPQVSHESGGKESREGVSKEG